MGVFIAIGILLALILFTVALEFLFEWIYQKKGTYYVEEGRSPAIVIAILVVAIIVGYALY